MKDSLDVLVTRAHGAGLTYKEFLEIAVKAFLQAAIDGEDGNICRAAKGQQMHRNTMGRLLKQYGVRYRDSRPWAKKPVKGVAA